MNDNSWFKMYRKILSWEWFNDTKTLHVFIYLLCKANVNSNKFQGKTIKRGQLITSYSHIAEATGMSTMSARRAVANLVSTGEITTQQIRNYSLITITKYDTYQFEQGKEQGKEHQVKKKEEDVEAEADGEYIPKWWEREIPEQAWGKFQTEEEWFSYVEKHRDEVESWDMR